MHRSKRLLILVGVLAVVCAAAFLATRVQEQQEQVQQVLLTLPPQPQQDPRQDQPEQDVDRRAPDGVPPLAGARRVVSPHPVPPPYTPRSDLPRPS